MENPARPGGQQAAVLFLAAGALTLVNNYLPGSGHLDIAVLNTVGVLTCLVGWVAWVLPWARWSPRASLVLAPLAFAMIGFSNLFGGVGPYSHAVFFIVVFAWIGIAHPVGTSYWLSPLAAVAYAVPLAVSDRTAQGGVSSVTVAIPVCIMVAETIARSLNRLRSSEAELAAHAEQLERRRAHEQDVIDTMADGLAVLGPDREVRSWNTAAATLTGISADEVIGRALPFGVPAPGAVVVHQIGERRWLEAAAARLDSTGETVITLRDISRQKALDEARDVFLATASHELRTPLTVVKGYIGTLRRHFDQLSADSREDALRTVESRTDGLIELVDHLLVGSRAHTGHQLHPEPVDVGTLLRSVLDASARPSHLITVQVQRDLPSAIADRTAFASMVDQLLDNAVKYSPDGSEVTVSAATSPLGVEVCIADRGVGIPAGEERRVFQPFFQVGAVDRRQHGGMGLGLSIVEELAIAQGGQVRAEQRVGGGCVVRFTLPAAPSAVPAPRAGGSAAAVQEELAQ